MRGQGSKDKSSKGKSSENTASRIRKAVVGWLNRQSKDSEYQSVTLQRGGGLRKVEYLSTEAVTAECLLEKAKAVFFPDGRSKSGPITDFSFEMGDFKQEVINSFCNLEGEEVTLQEYIKSHGLFPSRVQFYMLTTCKGASISYFTKPSAPNTEVPLKDTSKADRPECISFDSSANASQETAEVLVPAVALVGDRTPSCEWVKNQQLEIRYDVPTESSYSREVVTISSFSRQQCKEIACLNEFNLVELPLRDFQPPEYGFLVNTIEKGDRQYVTTVEKESPDDTQELESNIHQMNELPQTAYAFPTADTSDMILHEPSEVWGYDNNELVIAVVTSCHNQESVYTWIRNNQKIKEGLNLCCLAVNEEGDYRVKVNCDGKEAESKVVKIVMYPTGSAFVSLKGTAGGSIKDTGQELTARCSIPVIDKSELNYDAKKGEIGRGSFGAVYKASWAGTLVAVKQMKVRNVSKSVVVNSEVHIHSQVRHPNIVQIMAVALGKNAVYIVCELVNGANLDELLFADEQPAFELPDNQKPYVAKQIVQAVAYLHNLKPPILHRDVKPANVLVASTTYVTKLCDMGLGKIKSAQTANRVTTTGIAGTPNYMAPECLIQKKKATTKADVWSLGCTLLELFTKKDCWGKDESASEKEGSDNEVQDDPQGCEDIYRLLKSKEVPNALLQLPATSFIKATLVKCFEYNEVKRPDAIEILECFH